jgi:hypothetical protein
VNAVVNGLAEEIGKRNSGGRKPKEAGCWWLTPVIVATQEAEIRKIMVRSQPRQIVSKTLSQKYPT